MLDKGQLRRSTDVRKTSTVSKSDAMMAGHRPL